MLDARILLEQLDYVNVKAGTEFWSWLNDDEKETQDWIVEGIERGVKEFSELNTDVSLVVGGAGQLLVKELQKKYGLPVEGILDWSFLVHAINDDRGEDIGELALETLNSFDLNTDLDDNEQ